MAAFSPNEVQGKPRPDFLTASRLVMEGLTELLKKVVISYTTLLRHCAESVMFLATRVEFSGHRL
jgi:hypothetical protein